MTTPINRAQRRQERRKLNKQQRAKLNRQDKLCTAFHEAAHAVIATVLGVEVGYTSVRPRQKTWGHTTYRTPEFVRRGEDYDAVIDRDHPDAAAWLEGRAIVCLAGPLGHRLALGHLQAEATSEDRAGWEMDRTEAENYASRLVEITREDIQEVGEYLDERARELVVRNSIAISTVAGTLMERGRLTSDELREIVGGSGTGPRA